jgi:hypothetical protein
MSSQLAEKQQVLIEKEQRIADQEHVITHKTKEIDEMRGEIQVNMAFLLPWLHLFSPKIIQGCGSGLIQSGYGSGSRNSAQSGYGSGSTMSLIPDPQQYRYFRRQIFSKIKKSTTKSQRY